MTANADFRKATCAKRGGNPPLELAAPIFASVFNVLFTPALWLDAFPLVFGALTLWKYRREAGKVKSILEKTRDKKAPD